MKSVKNLGNTIQELRGDLDRLDDVFSFFFFQAEDGIRDHCVTAVQTCALPISVDVLAVWLRSNYGGARVLGVGHRVVHGGMWFTAPTVVDRHILAHLYELVPLAPLHQPYNLAAIEAVFSRLPDVPQVTCCDTSFHRGQPPVAEVIPLPRDLCKAGVQRYGFHGLSYEYVASVLPEVAPEIAGGRVIVAHLGSGASMCALQEGRSLDSTLGFTALDGLCMGTRPGALDPGIVLYLLQSLSLSPKDIETILYKK